MKISCTVGTLVLCNLLMIQFSYFQNTESLPITAYYIPQFENA